MPRVGREQSGTGIYHVMLRGINRQDIFEEPEDYWTFIKILSTVQERLEDDLVTRTIICHIYAYCLMPNHVHLLLGEKRWKVGDVMKSIASSYVFYYNKKYACHTGTGVLCACQVGCRRHRTSTGENM